MQKLNWRSLVYNRWYLGVEFAILFLGLPLIILVLKKQILMFLLLWVGAFLTKKLYRGYAIKPVDWHTDIKPALRRFAVLAPFVVFLSWWLSPQLFMTLPVERPILWAAIMFLYPALSVWPQEMIYRKLIFLRYQPLLGSGVGYISASALAFGYGHLIMVNWLAVVLSTIGGYIFASAYAQQKSLFLVCFEHALYGCLIFTVGLGHYFYTGSAWQ